MMLAATMAGLGSAGVHILHSCAYPIASAKHEYQPSGYPDDHPFVPHGHSLIVTAPAAFRFTYDGMPDRHHRVAELLSGGPVSDPGPDALPDVRRELMRDVGASRGIAAFGYNEDDVPALGRGGATAGATAGGGAHGSPRGRFAAHHRRIDDGPAVTRLRIRIDRAASSIEAPSR